MMMMIHHHCTGPPSVFMVILFCSILYWHWHRHGNVPPLKCVITTFLSLVQCPSVLRVSSWSSSSLCNCAWLLGFACLSISLCVVLWHYMSTKYQHTFQSFSISLSSSFIKLSTSTISSLLLPLPLPLPLPSMYLCMYLSKRAAILCECCSKRLLLLLLLPVLLL